MSRADVCRELRERRLEDAAWMAATGENLDGAAERLGMKPHGLADYLRRNGAGDIARVLNERNPRDHNALVWKGGPAQAKENAA